MTKLHRNSGRKLLATVFAATCLSLTACDSAKLTCVTDCPAQPTDDGNTLIDVATANGNFTTLLAALEAANLTTVLSDPNSEFTVFAPTDAAFTALGNTAVTDLLADEPLLSDTLLYHVLPGEVDAATALGLVGTITMQNGKDAVLSLDGEDLKINAATITATDIATSNGIIHVIDAVLTPPADPVTETTPVNLVETATDAGNFTTLITALEASGLDQVLADESQSYTVFAPTDAAFDALEDGALDALLADPAALESTLLYHVVPNAVDAATATDLAGNSITMQSGDDASLTLTDGTLMINSANVIATDVMASNGLIHVIDAVLTVPDTTTTQSMNIVEALADNPNYSSLLSAIQSNGLDATLASTENITVFAPNNAAFAAANLDAGISGDQAAMEVLLLGHVLPDQVVDAATALTLDGQSITMLNGANRTITVEGGTTVKIDGATVVDADISAANGIIHGIDAVLQ